MLWTEKPVIVVGFGCTGMDLSKLYTLGVPILTSWQAADLVDNTHPLYYGRPGIYGQRTANKVLYEATQILALGCRLCTWMIGHGGLRPEQEVTMVDIDGSQVERIPGAVWGGIDIPAYIETLEPCANSWVPEKIPVIEAAHADTGFINSYRVMERLEQYLRPDEIICVDNGSLLCPVMQVLRFKPPQRVMTSGCLGEMGCALPAAVGAAFASPGKDVITFVGDGGMMMNIQELATIRHHNLPVKIMIFENDGYSMIKGTYGTMNLPRQGVSFSSGLSFPSFWQIGRAWKIPSVDLANWTTFDRKVSDWLGERGPAILVVHIDPEQEFVPRLRPIVKDGKITPARFDQLSPLEGV